MTPLVTVAKEFTEKYDLVIDDKTVADKIRNYISNCMLALGVSLDSFTDKKGKNSYKITDELKEHIEDVFSEKVYGNGEMDRIINKAQLSKSVKYHAFGTGTVTEDIVFVTKQFVKANFEDATYASLKEELRGRIKNLERERKDVLKRLNSTGDLTEGLFCITLNRDIFDSVAMDKYFQEIERCYKEYEILEKRRLTEKDLVLLDFLGLNNKLKIIEQQLSIEILKKVYSN